MQRFGIRVVAAVSKIILPVIWYTSPCKYERPDAQPHMVYAAKALLTHPMSNAMTDKASEGDTAHMAMNTTRPVPPAQAKAVAGDRLL